MKPSPAALSAALALLWATPTLAHVTLADPKAAPGAYYVSFFRIGHGCAGSATTALRVEIPDGINAARAQPKAGWTLEVEHAPLSSPVKGEGGKMLTERVKAITWRGGPLPDDEWDQFGVSLKLPDTPGKLYFPAVQTCETGEARWVETPARVGERLSHPAPALEIAAGGGGDSMAGMDMSGMEAAPAKPPSTEASAGHETARRGVVVLDPWIAKPPQGAPTAAGYLTLRNDGAAPDTFLGARTTAARELKLHSMTMAGGIMRMRPVEGGLVLPPGKTIVIGPSSGYHLMVIGSKRPLKVGDKVPAVLKFAKAGEIAVTFDVRPLSSTAAMSGMAMK